MHIEKKKKKSFKSLQKKLVFAVRVGAGGSERYGLVRNK